MVIVPNKANWAMKVAKMRNPGPDLGDVFEKANPIL